MLFRHILSSIISPNFSQHEKKETRCRDDIKMEGGY